MHTKQKKAIFAYQCDKLECDLQCKLYDEEGCVDLSYQKSTEAQENVVVQELLKTGKTWSDMWLTFDLAKYPYDGNFRRIVKFAKDNKISTLCRTKKIK